MQLENGISLQLKMESSTMIFGKIVKIAHVFRTQYPVTLQRCRIVRMRAGRDPKLTQSTGKQGINERGTQTNAVDIQHDSPSKG